MYFRFLRGFAEEYLILIKPMLRMDKLTDKEYHALLVLAFCDNGSVDLEQGNYYQFSNFSNRSASKRGNF